MSGYRQLLMRWPEGRPLPDLTPPEGVTVHAADGHERASWNWIARAAFDPRQNYDMIADDPGCAPEGVFFVRVRPMDVATATARLMDDGTGCVHMVAVHPWYQGLGLGKYAVVAAVKRLSELGVSRIWLSTDDFRLPAIRTYRALGFEPMYDPGDEEMVKRWTLVNEQLAQYRPPVKEEPIPLWDVCPEPDKRSVMPTLTPFTYPGARGAVIVCPGGAYTHLAAHEGDPVARMIRAAGVSAYVLRYSIYPFGSLETPLRDALRAIRMVRSMGYEKVAILGFSAGGHLCAAAATLYTDGDPAAEDQIERLSSRPDAFAPCYGATSLWHFRGTGWPEGLAGEHSVYDTIRRFSAEDHVTDQTPPAFIWHTADDNVVPVACAYDLARALSAHGIPLEMHIYPHGPHGLGLAGDYEDISGWAPQCQRWLKGMGYDAPHVI